MILLHGGPKRNTRASRASMPDLMDCALSACCRSAASRAACAFAVAFSRRSRSFWRAASSHRRCASWRFRSFSKASAAFCASLADLLPGLLRGLRPSLLAPYPGPFRDRRADRNAPGNARSTRRALEDHAWLRHGAATTSRSSSAWRSPGERLLPAPQASRATFIEGAATARS